jgi:aspartate carbamoyltransferase catalytic subunit
MVKKKAGFLKPKNPPPKAEGFFLPDFPKNLLGIKELNRDQIERILTRAEFYKRQLSLPDKKSAELKGRTVINLFFEPSTRTRTSFELAARRLSADLLTITPQATSLAKGESLKDMTENLEAMHPDLLIVRHAASGVPGLMARYTKAVVINAGDGSHEHPTQALVDLFTVREKLERIQGVHLVIVGDIAYSRVARSNIYAFKKMGGRVTVCGPATLIPPGLETLGIRVCTDLDRSLPEADVVMLLRIQKERQEKLNFPSLAEYTRFYGLTRGRIALMKKEALIMHPGPINRGIEIDPEVADGLIANGPQTVILDQVTNGIAVRMAILAIWGRQ